MGDLPFWGLNMKEQDLQSFRERLEKMRSDLVEDSEETVHEMREENNLYPDPSDRATSETEHINLLRIRDRERKLMSKIDEAIDRLSNGSFGICEECGEEIDIERLNIRPVTTFCIRCKETLEAQENKS